MFSAKALSLASRRGATRLSSRTTGAQRLMGGDATPVPNSMKAKLWQGHPEVKEGWEETIYFYYGVSAIAIFCIINFSPDTTIEAWAEQEARARLALKDKGFTDFEFGKHYQDEVMSGHAVDWDKFTSKAIKPGEDDDDDDEDDEDEDDEDEDDDDDE